MAVKSPADYRRQLMALLPKGAAWARQNTTKLHTLIDGMAQELARVDQRGEALISEADPRKAVELLTDWERVTGLPDDCLPEAGTQSERRSAVLGRLSSTGGQSVPFFIDLAEALGFTVSIVEFDLFVAGSDAGDLLYGDDWVFSWQVQAPEETVNGFAVGEGAAGEPLADWGNEQLECGIERANPAHATVLFAYGS